MIHNRMDGIPKSLFKIELLNIASSGNYSSVPKDLSLFSLNKKIVIIYSASDMKQHNITDYHELDYIIDLFSYKYYLDYKYFPTVNLIGHSRGGLTNLQYVNEHPFNVDSVFSIDTPYFGSEFGQMTTLMDMIGLSDTINSCGGQDILDTGIDITNPSSCDFPLTHTKSGSGTLQETYLTSFHDAKEENPNIKAYAIGSAITFEGIFDVVIRMIFESILSSDLTIMQGLVNDQGFKDVINAAKLTIDVVNFFVNPDSLLSFVLIALDYAKEYIIHNYPTYANQIEQYIDSVSYLSIFNNVSSSISAYTYVDTVVANPLSLNEAALLDDLFIHLASQLGDTGYQDYGFTTFVKIYSSHDSDLLLGKKSLNGQPAIPHNLVARDQDVIEYIVSNIRQNKYQFVVASSGTMKLISSDAKFNNINVPAKDLTGNVVSDIGETAFSGNSHITDIYLPASITTIHEKAFLNLPNLKSVTVAPNNPTFKSIDGMLINTATNTLIYYPVAITPPLAGCCI